MTHVDPPNVTQASGSRQGQPLQDPPTSTTSARVFLIWVVELTLSAVILWSLVVHGMEHALLLVHWASILVILPHEITVLCRYLSQFHVR